jgi:hypothetical protein
MAPSLEGMVTGCLVLLSFAFLLFSAEETRKWLVQRRE